MRSLGVAIVALAVLAGLPALAQDAPNPAVINAVAYRPLPAGLAFAVRSLDDSRRSMAAAAEMEQVLRGSGRTVAANAPLMVTLDVQEVSGSWSDGGRRTVIELTNRGDAILDRDNRAILNLYDSSRGGIMNRGQNEPGTSIVTPGRHRIEAMVDDRAGGHRLWQGWIEAGTDRQDDVEVVRSMIAPLVARLGETVRQETVELP